MPLYEAEATFATQPGSLNYGLIPEPGSLALLGTGIIGVFGAIRRKINQ